MPLDAFSGSSIFAPRFAPYFEVSTSRSDDLNSTVMDEEMNDEMEVMDEDESLVSRNG